MPDSVSSLTVPLDAGVVATAVRVASDVDLAPELLLARACAALTARFTRTDDPSLATGIAAVAAPEPAVTVRLLPDGGADAVLRDVPADVAHAVVGQASAFAARALAEPYRPLGVIDAIGDDDWSRLVAWSAGEQITLDGPAHEKFADWAHRQPDAVALSTGDTTMTFRDALHRATSMAGELIDRGVRPGDPVGILFDRGPDSVLATVAVAMAGATAVPLDPAYPAPRLRLMLEEPGVVLTLTSRELAGLVPVGTAVASEDCDSVTARDRQQATPDVAALMYTSGTTGAPKGVLLTHRGISRLVHDPRIGIGPDDVVLHLAPATFDASLLEVWGALANGARLEIAPPGPPTLRELAEVITAGRITVLWLTAGLFHQLAEHEPDCFKGVRALFTGGDVVSPHAVSALLSRHPDLTVVNGYGPTENTTFTCCHPLSAPLPPGTATVPIGTPIANTSVYLVDRGGQPVPPGVAGELWAAGDGLALGYLGKPEQTEEKFPTPDTGLLRGVRCYRTGDLARFTDDGVLEFLGREDGQVKINGHRIELGEVEQAILAQPGVRGTCVMAETDPLGGKRLVAYLVGDGPRLAREVRNGLRTALPAYLVPARYVLTESLPLTANGKVDRVRLRAGESETS
ncbi:amino acid adenylation domain-containing protein [Actinokineospora alba]|uniref:Amino acid adenylation domain-containing protein n=1 Tax=Actinokineospora alba TaxID=504798 RepID=A0A1H0FD94_9PSEU|nr:amino acid adenylation domain-containing protein [Actinokineospora alba]TDP69434.1 amino acid adenylation domain-containing protein [Actinokineospora alba]SDI16879.1 amino acid adenylation domain-containing protein [Actinokineospora alba]SDN92615.1 amino acid adenylation domain-containing protein [Actinokineospora alba]